MPMLQIECPYCAASTRIDSDRLPPVAVTLPCPSCQGHVVLVKNELLAGGKAKTPDEAAAPPTQSRAPSAGAPAAAPRPPTASPPSPALPSPEAAPRATPAPATPATPAPGAGSAARPVLSASAGPLLPPNFSIPAGTVLPSGIVLAEGESAAELLRSLEAWGSKLDPLASADVVRQIEYTPELQILVTGSLSAPPLPSLAPMIDLPPRERRRTFVVLVAEDAKTMDGNQAFLYEVDLTLHRSDMARAAELIYLGLEFQRHLYSAYFSTESALAEL